LINFRYHALSLSAVFLALAIGILIGVEFGEKGVVSSASEDLERSIRGDLDEARRKNSELRRELNVRDDFERQSYAGLVSDLLPGFRIGIVAMGDLPSDYAPAIRDAVEPAGAEVESISVIRAPLPLARLADDLDGTKVERLDRDGGGGWIRARRVPVALPGRRRRRRRVGVDRFRDREPGLQRRRERRAGLAGSQGRS
jgi:hypothetical protein